VFANGSHGSWCFSFALTPGQRALSQNVAWCLLS
jgi:hypothetical protein